MTVAAKMGAHGHVVDITDAAAVEAALRPIARIDVLINNAGIEAPTPLDSNSSENERTFPTAGERLLSATSPYGRCRPTADSPRV